MQALNGYKTYIVAAVTIAYAVIACWSGSLTFNEAAAMVLGGAGLGALRNAVPGAK